MLEVRSWSLLNIDPQRFVMEPDLNNVIEATIFGKYKGKQLLIPRIPMIPTDTFHLQFPIRIAFGT